MAQHWELNWLNIESQVDSTLRVKLTQHWESNWLNIESPIDSTLRVQLTQHWESNWLKNILQLLTLPGWIIIPPVTQLLRSKWLKFFYRCTERKMSHFDLKSQFLVPPVTQLLGSNFSYASDSTFYGQNDSIFSLGALSEKIESFWPKKLCRILISPVTQLLRSKWLNFFLVY